MESNFKIVVRYRMILESLVAALPIIYMYWVLMGIWSGGGIHEFLYRQGYFSHSSDVLFILKGK